VDGVTLCGRVVRLTQDQGVERLSSTPAPVFLDRQRIPALFEGRDAASQIAGSAV
jgi:hypothetical protein